MAMRQTGSDLHKMGTLEKSNCKGEGAIAPGPRMQAQGPLRGPSSLTQPSIGGLGAGKCRR
jgi:hypothetical protein